MPATPSKAAKPPAARSTQFDLVEDYGFNLDDNPVRPRELDPKGQGLEVWWDDFYNSVMTGRGARLIEDESDSLAECKNATRYTSKLNQYELLKGDKICVISETGTVGLMEITEAGSEYFGVRLTVWPAQ
ncbi:hypothetical protein [Streptomyces roseolus]|uniref:hypothetical protein n=1 Tax=Streptomyces roseolus TaxID=67358 RepID=UPI001676C4D2|nr:hypothetical protein [Streptomyces roseolus]